MARRGRKKRAARVPKENVAEAKKARTEVAEEEEEEEKEKEREEREKKEEKEKEEGEGGEREEGEKEISACQAPQPRSMRTIHDCARDGDLVGLQKFLQEDPSLLNARNPILLQTPLHTAARCNSTNIIQFLLDDWKGSEKVELEATDMYDETPLHLAAKNGCSESVRELLSHGAFLEAKTKNGMTPLHLAVWTAAELSKDCATVTLLLEYNADCNIKDNNGCTALDYSKKPHAEELQELLNEHVEKQRRRQAIESCTETRAKMAEFEAALSNIVGLQQLKMQLLRWAKGVIVDERRRAFLGLNMAPRKPAHMAFLGNPGTGKTMVARILGRLLHTMGILPTNKITEVQRTDLVGEFVGHTGPKTRRKIQEAEGGILFVDEAYRLIPMQKTDDKDYGIEALEEIMSVMDSGKVMVIFAGYCEPMKRLITSNQGFCRRVTKFFYFDNFSSAELAQILHLKINDQDSNSFLHRFKLDGSCTVEAIAELLDRGTTEQQRKAMNGGLIDALLVNAYEEMDQRLYESDCTDGYNLVTITMEDLEAGLRRLPQSEWL